MTEIFVDNETSVVSEVYAVVYAPRKNRKRFPANCVTVVDSAADAIKRSDPDNKQYAVKLLGPSRSSEGLMLYYFVAWLEA